MGLFQKILQNLPEVEGPTQKKLDFKQKLIWTLIILIAFYILGLIPLWGLGQNALQQFEFLSLILGAEFGSIISLGIGPIVTGSIVLQLLTGSKILKIDTSTSEGRKFFQGLQKFLSIAFIIFEAAVYVFMGGLAPSASLAGAARMQMQLILILQLFIGGMLILFMAEVIDKWGFSSGISMFIAAGVSKSILVRALSPLASPTNPEMPTGAIPALFKSLAAGDPTTAALMLAAVISTILVFVIAVYAQAMKVEIPLSFGRVRGYGVRWPLAFMYTSNIPVILVAALLANVQLFARLLQNSIGHGNPLPILGGYTAGGSAVGFVATLHAPDILRLIVTKSITWTALINAFIYVLVMVGGSVLFAYFWVQTSGMDAKSQAKQIINSGLQVPGFRRDERVLERMLDRYIMPLTIMGAIAVGLLAAIADLSGALSRGTGILLAVMIVYKLYEQIAQQHMMDMNPALRKFMGKQ